MSQQYLLGCIDDPKDNQDLMLADYMKPVYLPKAISWTDFNIPVSDQGNMPACVGYAGANLKKAQEKLEVKTIINIDALALYKELKKIDGIPDQGGTYIRVLMKYLQQTGVKDFLGNVYKISAYTKINSLDELKASIMANGFAVLGVNVYDSFYKPEHGVVNYIEGQQSHGLHAILAEGYDDNTGRVVIKNSWSADWGLGGYCYLSYKYIEKGMQVGWTSVDMANDNTLASSVFNLEEMRNDYLKIIN